MSPTTPAASRSRSWWRPTRGRRSGSRRTRARIRSGSIFSKRGTTFTSLAFSPNGERLWWTAEHAEGYPGAALHEPRHAHRIRDGVAGHGGNGGRRPQARARRDRSPPSPRGARARAPGARPVRAVRRRSRCPTRRGPPRRSGGSTGRRCSWAPVGAASRLDLYAVDGRGQDDPAVARPRGRDRGAADAGREPARGGARSPTRRGTASRRRRVIAPGRPVGRQNPALGGAAAEDGSI